MHMQTFPCLFSILVRLRRIFRCRHKVGLENPGLGEVRHDARGQKVGQEDRRVHAGRVLGEEEIQLGQRIRGGRPSSREEKAGQGSVVPHSLEIILDI